MTRVYKKNEKVQIGLFTLSCALVVLGILFLMNAMGAARIFPAFYDIENVLAKYIVVLITMICGIMLFSNVALTLENKKWRNGLTIGVTTFSTVLTLPLVYVFIAIFAYQASGTLDGFGKAMALDKIAEGFVAWFGSGGVIWFVYVVMLLVSIIFISFPLVTGILAIKGKTIKVGKQPNGKFGVGLAPLPVIAKQESACGKEDCECHCECRHDDVLAEAACDKEEK